MATILEINNVRLAAADLMKQLAHANALVLIKTLMPQPDDYDRVFVHEVADQARQAYEHLWSDPPVLATPTQTEVETFAVQADTFLVENEFSREFPGGYRKIAKLLKPEPVWVRFRFTEPGQSTGVSYDGLVWLDGRWGWFPKPWRYIELPVNN